MIFVSAGHHQQAQGAAHGLFSEWREAQVWQSLLVSQLAYHGLDVMPVPSGTINDKAEFINQYCDSSDLALEIHFNSQQQKGHVIGQGGEALFHPACAPGRLAAQALQGAVSVVFSLDGNAVEGWFRGNPDNGLDWFLDRVRCAAVIIAPDYVEREAVIVQNRESACRSMAKALAGLQNRESACRSMAKALAGLVGD